MARSGKKLLHRRFWLFALLRRWPYVRNVLRLIWRLMRDVRVPIYLKAMLVLAMLYVLSPVDLLPASFLLLIGVVDDLAVILLAIKYFLRWCPEAVVMDHLAALAPDFQVVFKQWYAS
jgi:uncharacterized membrane protein YkvA (DUF1232 family)